MIGFRMSKQQFQPKGAWGGDGDESDRRSVRGDRTDLPEVSIPEVLGNHVCFLLGTVSTRAIELFGQELTGSKLVGSRCGNVATP